MRAVVFGIITNTFGTLRDRDTVTKADKKNTCFVCGASRQAIEARGESFANHTSGIHDVSRVGQQHCYSAYNAIATALQSSIAHCSLAVQARQDMRAPVSPHPHQL